MLPIKTYLQNESEFFWNIFGGTYYLHLWMHQEGLISIDEIIQRVKMLKYPLYTKYFLPELIEEVPEIFEKEIKPHIKFEYSNESIEKFKELRRKHFNWIKESNDFNDPLYREIETDSLRLAIKLDDIETFQKFFSNLNLNVNSTIKESLLENFFSVPVEMSMIMYSILFNSVKIFKFLIMNGAETHVCVYASLWSRNYEIIHCIESIEKKEFESKSLYYSIILCNDEMIEYSLNNFDGYPLEKTEFNDEDEYNILCIIENTFKSFNFLFFETTLLPFLRKNKSFVDKNITKIFYKLSDDYSCFFIKEFLKNPNIDINMYSDSSTELSILEMAIHKRNKKLIEMLLKMPDIDLNSYGYKNLTLPIFACASYSSLSMFKMICEHPKIKIDFDELFSHCIFLGNYIIFNYLIENYENECFGSTFAVMHTAASNKYFYTLKLIVKYDLKRYKNFSCEKYIDHFKEICTDEKIISMFTCIVHELLAE